MKFFSKAAKDSLSLLLAFVMLMSVFSAGAPAVFAAESKNSTAGDSTPDEFAPGNIEDIQLKPIKVYKYSDDYDRDYDEEDNEWYNYDYRYRIEGELKLKSGETYPIECGCVCYDGEEYKTYDLDIKDDQRSDNEWGAGVHEAEVSFNGFKTKLEVEVIEFDIEKVEVFDTEATIGLDMDEDYYYEFEDEEEIEHYYSFVNYPVKFKVTLKNGEVIEPKNLYRSSSYFRYKKADFRFFVNDGQEKNTWEKGTHKATLELFGEEYTFNVNVKETPVEKVEVDDVTVYEGLDFDDDDGYCYTPSIKVTMKDGSVYKSNNWGEVYINDEYYEIQYSDGQTYDNPWGVGAHKVKGSFMGKDFEFTVNVVKVPVVSLEVEDCNIFKNSGDMFTEILPDFTLTLENGEKIKSKNGYAEIYGRSIRLNISEYGDDLSVGSHKLKASVFGKTDEFIVTVYDRFVKKIEAEDITVTQGVDVYFGAKLDIRTKAKLTLADDTVIETDQLGEFRYRDDIYDELDFELDQGEYLKPGTYKAIAKYGGVSAEYNVTVLPSKFKKVEFENVVMYKDMDNKPLNATFDEAAPEGVTSKYHYDPSFKITAEDGTVYTNMDNLYGEGELYNKYVKYNGRNYIPVFFDDQYTNAWDIGVHKVRGYILGVEAEFTVEIKPNPVKSVSCEDIYVIEPTDEYCDEAYISDAELTLTLTDGTTKKVSVKNRRFNYDGRWYDAKFDYLEDFETGGTYKINGEALGFGFTANVYVIKCPVKSVSVTPVTLIDGQDNYSEEGYSYYYFNKRELKYTVTLNDGTELKSDENGEVKFMNAYYCFEDVYLNSSSWKPGNTYSCRGMILGYEAKFDVNVIESPVKSVVIEDMNVNENDYTRWYDYDIGDYFNYYSYVPEKFTITLKDGTVINGTNGSFEYNGRRFYIDSNGARDTQSSKQEWSAGNSYNVTFTVLGYNASAKVNIVKDSGKITPEIPTVDPLSPNTPSSNNTPKTITVKKTNPVKISAKTKTVKAKKLKKKKQAVKPLTIKNAQGKVTVTKVKKGTAAKIFKKITVNKKTGAITFKKGKYAKKTYKIKLKITVKGNSKYKPAAVTKTVKIKVK